MRQFWHIAVIAAAMAAASVTTALAHPHVFVDGAVELNLDKAGELVSVTNIWTFDAPFSAFATQGLDTDGDGKLSDAELAPLAETNMDALSYYHFFTYVSAAGAQSEFGKPEHYCLKMAKKRLTLHFTLPVTKPVKLSGDVNVEVFDPEYFVAFTFDKKAEKPVPLGRTACTMHYRPPKELNASIMAKLAAIPADEHDLPPALKDAAAGLAHVFLVACP